MKLEKISYCLKKCAISDDFNGWFPIVFKSVYSGLPKGIEFISSDFCQPQKNPGTDLILCSDHSKASKKSNKVIE